MCIESQVGLSVVYISDGIVVEISKLQTSVPPPSGRKIMMLIESGISCVLKYNKRKFSKLYGS